MELQQKEVTLIPQIDWIEDFQNKYETLEEYGFIYSEMFFKNEDMKNDFEYLETIHDHRHISSKNICVFRKNNEEYLKILNDQGKTLKIISTQIFLGYKELLQAFKYSVFYKEKDIYISMSTFVIKKRNADYIRHLRALFVDLDIEKAGLTRVEVDKILEEKINKGIIPRYTLKNDSGRGYHLIWSIEDAPKQALPIWQFVEEKLIKALIDVGADKSVNDCTRVLRVVGTINSKNGEMCQLLENSKRMYLLRNLYDVFMDREEKAVPKDKKKIKTTSNIRHRFTLYSLHYARKEDLLIICELRKWQMKGHREKVLFLYRYWSCVFLQDMELALEQTLDLNQKFVNPLSKWEVVSATRSAEKYFNDYLENKKEKKAYVSGKYIGFNPRNSTLIDFLDITEEEQKHLKTIISTEEKYRRNNKRRNEKRRNEKGLTPKQQEIVLRGKKIQELKNQGYKQKEVAKKLSVSLRTVKSSWNI